MALGLNYRDHALEFGHPLPEEPLLFIKPSTAVIGPDEDIVYPAMSRRVDYEAELAVVIGRTCRHVKEEDFRDYVLGYTAINDVTARDLQKKDGQFTRSKSFDTFAPLGPWIETAIPDPDNLTVEAYLNGERRQHGNTGNMVFGVAAQVSFISRIMTLLPGDVIATGTPFGHRPHGPRRRGGNPGGRCRHVAKSRVLDYGHLDRGLSPLGLGDFKRLYRPCPLEGGTKTAFNFMLRYLCRLVQSQKGHVK